MPVPAFFARLSLCLSGLLLLTACGQKGPLHLPQEPAAAQRATLPQSVLRTAPQPTTDPTLATPTSPQP